jgi:hypothetical protein
MWRDGHLADEPIHNGGRKRPASSITALRGELQQSARAHEARVDVRNAFQACFWWTHKTTGVAGNHAGAGRTFVRKRSEYCGGVLNVRSNVAWVAGRQLM